MTFLDRLLGRPPTTPIKAAYGAGVAALQNLPALTVYGSNQQERIARYLAAYKVGWFYKAERKISSDFGTLKVLLSPEDSAGDNEREITAPDPFTPLEMLNPMDQFLRLMEKPNPQQTGRQLRAKAMIRHDMAGAAFFYLESPDPVYGIPSALYGISPARMWPSYDREGHLIGWVMDKERNGPNNGKGVPFEVSEIIPWMTGSADDSIWGVGIVEAVYAQVPLTDLMARHTADVLTTGGRMAGAMWPKNRALEEGEFQDAQRAWRNVVSDPNSAKRLLLFPEPMEYAAGASTPQEIGIPELAALNREEILSAFPIDPVVLGVPAANGLGGGEERRWQRLAYWEGTMHPRVESFEEVIQAHLVSRYEKRIGEQLDFDVEEPNLDDAPTLIEKAGAMKALVSLGFDPKEAVSAVGLDHIPWVALPPAPVAPAVPDESLQIKVNDTTRQDNSQTTALVKGSRGTTRDDVILPAERRATTALQTFLVDQRARVVERIRATWPASKAARKALSPEDWWDEAAETQALEDTLSGIYVSIGRGTTQVVADQLERVITRDVGTNIINDLLAEGGKRITAINEVTREALIGELSTGISRGYSLSQIIDGYASEKYAGIQNVLLNNGAEAFGDARAETIARTESALAYNRAALTGYKEYEVKTVVAIDGDKDAECADRNGKVYSVDDAYGIADHPNGTLDWSPVGYGKAVMAEPNAFETATKAQFDELRRLLEQRPIHVEVAPAPAPIVTIERGAIQVHPAEVNVHPAVVNVHPSPITVHMPSGNKKVIRDDKGQLMGVTDA